MAGRQGPRRTFGAGPSSTEHVHEPSRANLAGLRYRGLTGAVLTVWDRVWRRGGDPRSDVVVTAVRGSGPGVVDREQTLAWMRDFRQRHPRGGVSIRELIDEGR